jgi:hypothetical protein
MAPKKPNPDFLVRLVAPGLKPWVVPVRTLAHVLEALQRLVDQKDSEEEEQDIPSEISAADAKQGMRLIGLKDTSAAYAVSAPDRELALTCLKNTGQSIKRPELAQWTPATISSIKELSEIAKSLGCEIEFRQPGQGRVLGDVIATIRPSTYQSITGFAFIYGETSVFGKIERVGGATEMHCGLRLPDHPKRMVICRVVGEELVRELGQYMYQYVMVNGRATWVKHNKRLKHLEIRSFERPKTGSIRAALDAIYDAGGDAWDAVDDPAALISEIRGE